MMKDKDAKVLKSTRGVTPTWKESFKDLMNEENDSKKWRKCQSELEGLEGGWSSRGVWERRSVPVLILKKMGRNTDE